MGMKIFLIVLFSTLSFSSTYTDKAYDDTVYQNSNSLDKSRIEDSEFSYFDPFCCCNDWILDLFRERMEKDNKKVNPATDTLINSLSMMYESIDLMLKEVKNLRVTNGIYSFRDKGEYEATSVMPEVEVSDPDAQGCRALDFRNEADKEWYLRNVIDRFESKGNYNAHNNGSGAHGRYQFIPSTGLAYCSKLPSNMGCGCTDVPPAWHSSPSCQDAMFSLFQKDNLRYIRQYPINSCTVYIAHQQGAGGMMWLYGGKNPYSSFAALRGAIKSNVPASIWNSGVASGLDQTEDGLRKIFKTFWDKKFGGDIYASVGREVNLEDFLEETDNFSGLRVDREAIYREGIIFELYREKETIKNLMKRIR